MIRRKTRKNGERIPPPPGPEQGYDAIIAYFGKYPSAELEKAGHLTEVDRNEEEELAAAAILDWLRTRGLRMKLTRHDLQHLSRLAVQQHVSVEDLVSKWVQQRIRQEFKNLSSRAKG